MSLKKFIAILVLIPGCLCITGWGILFFSSTPPLLDNIRFSTAVYDQQQRLLRLTLSPDDKYRLFTPLSDISPHLIAATLLQEDRYFRWHYGVNPLSMLKAAWQTYGVKARRVGASTITMQLARIRYGIHSRKISGKIWQVLRALQLEMHYSKDQILEAYLNLAPYGGNIEGVGAASLIYFNNSAAKISLPQALTLSVIPQNPGKRTPQHKQLQQIRNKLFARWLTEHPEDSVMQSIMDLPLEMRSIRSMPFFAPHFVTRVLSELPFRQQQITTTLDLDLQIIVERLTRLYLLRKKNLGVSNAAILLVDTRDMSIKSALGSGEFSNVLINGQINGTDIKRSPGSTLKPFIYALALDQGLIHPATVLRDVPHSFGSYNPENFDYDFMGPVKARDALVLSRNIPAIYLASKLTGFGLFRLLEEAQVSQLKPESWYGLALGLGGVELSMKELTGLYAMLANNGIWRPLRALQDEPPGSGKRLLSAEASYLILDILKNTARPDSLYSNGGTGQYPVSWKTGTSSGYRDAWSVGVFGPYVLTVWVGNFNNKGNPAFIGKNIAAPLFFELAEAIRQEKKPLPVLDKNPRSMNLEQVAVCKASGMLPTRYCTDTEMTWFIPGKSPIKTDTIYREVAIDKNSGLRTCHFNEDTRFEIYEFWSSDLLKIFKSAGISRRIPPPWEPGCLLAGSVGISPQITSPQSELHYIVPINSSQKTLIPLSTVTDADVRTVYWFINETFLAKVPAGRSFLWPAKAGKFIVRVVDDHGLSDACDLVVEEGG